MLASCITRVRYLHCKSEPHLKSRPFYFVCAAGAFLISISSHAFAQDATLQSRPAESSSLAASDQSLTTKGASSATIQQIVDLVKPALVRIQVVESSPQAGREVRPGVRKLVTRRFPYSVIYRVIPGYVLVLAVVHHRRHPRRWHDRL